MYAAGQAAVQGPGEFIGYVEGDVFSGRVQRGIERREIVEIAVMEAGDQFAEGGLDPVEVAEETLGIQARAGNSDGDMPVVTMQGLALIGEDNGVGRGKLGGDGDLEHGGKGRGGGVPGEGR